MAITYIEKFTAMPSHKNITERKKTENYLLALETLLTSWISEVASIGLRGSNPVFASDLHNFVGLYFYSPNVIY